MLRLVTLQLKMVIKRQKKELQKQHLRENEKRTGHLVRIVMSMKAVKKKKCLVVLNMVMKKASMTMMIAMKEMEIPTLTMM